MKTETVYEYVCKIKAVPQDRFFAALNYTVRELVSKFGADIVMESSVIYDIVRLKDSTGVREEFSDALIDNILYLLTGDADRKTDFTAHAQYAYHTVWNEKNRGKGRRKEKW